MQGINSTFQAERSILYVQKRRFLLIVKWDFKLFKGSVLQAVENALTAYNQQLRCVFKRSRLPVF